MIQFFQQPSCCRTARESLIDCLREEMREACRALRGSILRQEIYALDGTDASDRPYSVSERNYTIEVFQPQGPNQYGVFLLIRARPSTYHYERKLYKVVGLHSGRSERAAANAQNAADPRVTHASRWRSTPLETSCNRWRSVMDADTSIPLLRRRSDQADSNQCR